MYSCDIFSRVFTSSLLIGLDPWKVKPKKSKAPQTQEKKKEAVEGVKRQEVDSYINPRHVCNTQ